MRFAIQLTAALTLTALAVACYCVVIAGGSIAFLGVASMLSMLGYAALPSTSSDE